MTALESIDIKSTQGWPRRARHWAPFVIVSLIGASGAFAAFHIASEAEDAHTRGVIELRAEWRARDFERKLGMFANSVEAMASLVASGETVNPEVFHRFAAHSYQAGDPLRRLIW